MFDFEFEKFYSRSSNASDYQAMFYHIESVLKYLMDIHYINLISWIIIIMFLYPISSLFFFFYSSVISAKLYKQWFSITPQSKSEVWDKYLQRLSVFIHWYSRIFHAYEVKGIENVPDTGPALVIYYHGTLPLDCFFFTNKIYFKKRRRLSHNADKIFNKLPGFKLVTDIGFLLDGGNKRSCVEGLQKGKLIAIGPGGIRESQFGNENYNIIFGKRIGFAEVAIEAKVPIIPVFTQNIREVYRNINLFGKFSEYLYEKFRVPVKLFYGEFPVKLITHIGEPIPYDPSITPEELAEKTKSAIKYLIDTHQRVPGRILHALKERFFEQKLKVI